MLSCAFQVLYNDDHNNVNMSIYSQLVNILFIRLTDTDKLKLLRLDKTSSQTGHLSPFRPKLYIEMQDTYRVLEASNTDALIDSNA